MAERPTKPAAKPPEDAGEAIDAQSIHRLEAQRRANRDAIAALGVNPYGKRTEGIISIAAAREHYDAKADAEHQAAEAAAKAAGSKVGRESDRRPVVRIAGRVMLKRDSGKLVWLQMRDSTSGAEKTPEATAEASGSLVHDLQVAVSQADCAEPGFQLAKALDLGDIVVASGPLMKTRAGEVTVWASGLEMGAKSLAPPPEKWKGLTDVDVRYRKRYVDLYATPTTMRVMKMRSAIVSHLRRFLDERGFLEVETPVLQVLAGGAAARPFKTHMNALSIDLFMRIAPELYLKRLLVGGMGRVYEMSRNFRNEGLDRSHNPEFTSLEVYEAFGDYRSMMDLTEQAIRAIARLAAGTQTLGEKADGDLRPGEQLVLPYESWKIDYGAPFRKVPFAELFQQGLSFPMTDGKRAREEAKRRGLKHEGVADILIVNELFEEVAEHKLDPQQPTFVIDYPAALSPLTRPKRDDPMLAERWDLFIGGMEVGPAYTELNDPDVQEAKFREQLAGIEADEATFRTFDQDFIEALKVGMPPAGGMGIGIDRLCMLLLNERSIRDVMLFPMMRPIE